MGNRRTSIKRWGWGQGPGFWLLPKGLVLRAGGGAEFTLGNRSYGHSLAEQCWVCLTGGSYQARTSLPAFRHKNKLGSIWEGFL